jgi:hypothetical protein
VTNKRNFPKIDTWQCDQIGRNLGYFLHNHFSPKQAVSTHGLSEDFKSNLMWMVWAFKLSFDEDILFFWPLFQKIRQNLIQFSGHADTWYR